MYILEIKQQFPALPDFEPTLYTVNQQYFLDYERPKAEHIAVELEEHFKRTDKPYKVFLTRISKGAVNG